MNLSFKKICSLCMVPMIIGLSHSSADGQAAKVLVDQFEVEELFSPVFDGSPQKEFNPKKWLSIETKLQVQMAPAPKSKICDQLLVKWYVAVENPERSGTLLLLTKEVEHINIPLEEDIYVSVYMSPSDVKKLLGEVRVLTKAVEFVGCEVLFNGTIIAAHTNKGKPGWWNVASPKISRAEGPALLDKAKTPYQYFWWDRYAEIRGAAK